jgi:hypothetical protein
MKYFLMLPGDTEWDAHFETNEIGEDTGFGVFWAGTGLTKLMAMVDKKPELLELIRIKTDSGLTLTLEEFLTKIQKLKVRRQ